MQQFHAMPSNFVESQALGNIFLTLKKESWLKAILHGKRHECNHGAHSWKSHVVVSQRKMHSPVMMSLDFAISSIGILWGPTEIIFHFSAHHSAWKTWPSDHCYSPCYFCLYWKTCGEAKMSVQKLVQLLIARWKFYKTLQLYSCLTFQQSLFLVAKEAWLKLSKVGNWGKLAKRFSSLVDFQNFLWSVFSQVSSVNKWNFGVVWG